MKDKRYSKVFLLSLFIYLSSFTPTSAQVLSEEATLNQLSSVLSALQSFINSLTPKSTAQTADITTGLVGHWKFDEGLGTTASDSSGNNNTGTLTNGPTWTTGKISQALDFDATDDYVSAGSASILDDLPSKGGMSISFWAYADSVGESSQGFFVSKQDADSGDHGWLFQNTITGSAVIFVANYNGGTDLSVISNTHELNKWIHWTVTWDGSATATNVRIYKNGSEVTYSTRTSGVGAYITDASRDLRIGNNNNLSRTFDGKLDDLRLYNRALSATDIAELYAYAGSGYPTPYTTPPPADTTPPTFSNLTTSSVTSSGATITWNTDENATSQVEYGLTTAYGNSTTLVSTLSTTHSHTLANLSPNTTYYYLIRSSDSAGNTSTSGGNTFTTSAASYATPYATPYPTPPPPSNTFYIRDGGTSSTCTDWTNACDTLPATLQRGALYYIADGSYAAYTFDDAVSGTQLITIKKAIVSDHGTDSGWLNSYGDGAAAWGKVIFSTSYWVFDGVTGGGPGSWKTGHGFTFNAPACGASEVFITASNQSNITVRHVAFSETGNTTACAGGDQAIYTSTAGTGTITDSLFEYLYFENLGGLPFHMRRGSGTIIQYNYTGDICGQSVFDGSHCEAIVISEMNDLHFRWNYIGESPSSGGFVRNSLFDSAGIRIYGNIFQNGFPINCNTTGATCTNWRIFNNTFAGNITSGPVGGGATFTNPLYSNNITFDAVSTQFLSIFSAHSHNWYSQVPSNSFSMGEVATENICNGCGPGGADDITETLDPFVNSAGNTPEDFRLTGPISSWPGTDVCALEACTGENKYNIDMFGKTRGADGVWDRGALEYESGAPYTTLYTTPAPAYTYPTPATLYTPTPNTSSGSSGISGPSGTPLLPPLNLTRNLSLGSTGRDVASLQEHLIREGYLAIGFNTGYYGSITKAAVQRYQCDKAIVCTGDEATTGYGVVGARTRATLGASSSASATTTTSTTTPSLTETERQALITSIKAQLAILIQQLILMLSQEAQSTN